MSKRDAIDLIVSPQPMSAGRSGPAAQTESGDASAAWGLFRAGVHFLLDCAWWVYRVTLAPLFGPCCRFAPSCSVYGREAVRRYGLARGGWIALKRILRCHPFHPGGWDPVV